jgi:hypothetical protein
MDSPSSALLARMPLAEAVLALGRWAVDQEHLAGLFQRYRGRGYEKVISFPMLVQWIGEALLEHGGSGHQSFSRALEAGQLEATLQAAYGKLRRLPIPLSAAFLNETSERLREVFPRKAGRLAPQSLQEMQIVILDGKAIKRVARRLKKLRGAAGGLLGGRALVALSFDTGMVVGMHAHPDGDANDVRFVPDLLPQVRGRLAGARLWMADRQFCDLVQMEYFTQEGDHFLVRYNAKVSFHRDRRRPRREGLDRRGRRFVEEWGHMGREGHKKRRWVRRITLFGPGQAQVAVVTDLVSPETYPADDLLELYLHRWGIEQVFQKVTEVFGLEGLIGGTPQATVFQFSFCLLLYNQIQVVRAYIAQHQARDPETVSLELLFVDVHRELTAWHVVVSQTATVEHFPRRTAGQTRAELHRLLGPLWSVRWIKSVNKKRRPHHPSRHRQKTHGSVFRILSGTHQPSRAKDV